MNAWLAFLLGLGIMLAMGIPTAFHMRDKKSSIYRFYDGFTGLVQTAFPGFWLAIVGWVPFFLFVSSAIQSHTWGMIGSILGMYVWVTFGLYLDKD